MTVRQFIRPSLFRQAATFFPAIVAGAVFLFFGRRALFGIGALGFSDETMHLLGGWALNSGERLYRDFVDLHGPGIFMAAQIYVAFFGWSHANDARLIILGLAVFAGFAAAASPVVLSESRAATLILYFGLLATVWLAQGLYLFSYYPISGAFAVTVLAGFVLPAIGRCRIPIAFACVAGAASVLLAFTSVSQAPSAVLFSAGGCLAAWQGGQSRAARAHLISVVVAVAMLSIWMVIWGDFLGYLTFHVIFAVTASAQIGHSSLSGFVASLTPSLQPDKIVQSAALIFTFVGSLCAGLLAIRPGQGRPASLFAWMAASAGLLLLNVRGLFLFQNGAFLMAGIGWFALAVPAALAQLRPQIRQPILAGVGCLAIVAITDAVLRHALFSPSAMTRSEFLRQPQNVIAARGEGPLFQSIRRLTRPEEHILSLVYTPQTYFAADRLPISGIYEYLPTDAIYASAPWFGEKRDICEILATSPPPVIVFDNWAVWGIYKPSDYMPCLFQILASKYRYLPEPGDQAPEAAKLYVRSDRLESKRSP